MKKLFFALLFISSCAFAQTSEYTIGPNDKMVSDVLARWAQLDNKKVQWDMSEWSNNKKYMVDFELKNKNDLNNKLALVTENTFRKKVRGLISIFEAQNKDLEFNLCFFDDFSVALWAHSSSNFKCSDFGSIYDISE